MGSSRKRKSEDETETSPDGKKRRLDVIPGVITHGRGGKPSQEKRNILRKEVEIINVDDITDDEDTIQLVPRSKYTKPATRTKPVTTRSRNTFPTTTSRLSKAVSQGSSQDSEKQNQSSQEEKKNAAGKPKKPTLKELANQEKERQKREKKMTYEEYIAMLPEKFPKREEEYKQYLAGATILPAQKMAGKNEFIKKQLDKLYMHGANVVSLYEPSRVTHLVTAGVEYEKVATVKQNIGRDIYKIPLRIKIVHWKWVSDCELAGKVVEPTKKQYIFQERWEPGQESNKGRRLAVAEASQDPVVDKKRQSAERFLNYSDDEEEDDQTKPSPTNYKKPRISRGIIALNPSDAPPTPPEDPLAEFYDLARGMSSDDESDSEIKILRVDRFRCMQKGSRPKQDCPNQDVINFLKELRKIHESRQEPEQKWKAYTLLRAIGIIKNYPTRFRSIKELTAIYGIGEKTAVKAMEIIRTGGLKRLDYERTPQVIAVQKFLQIHGVGNNVAHTWYNMGLRTIEDVRQGKFGVKLTLAQQIGVKYYDDLRTKMPRQEAKDIYDKINQAALSIDPKLRLEVTGSYRRGRQECGDVDIILTREPSDGVNHGGVLPELLEILRDTGLLVADLGGETNGGLEAKYMGVCRRSPGDKVRRLDILCIPFDQWGAALLYFTGDDIFNRSMRLLANKKGMSLNQRGLWDGVLRDTVTKQKISVGHIIASRTEKEIFDILKVPWQEPHERIRA